MTVEIDWTQAPKGYDSCEYGLPVYFHLNTYIKPTIVGVFMRKDVVNSYLMW